MKVKFIPFEFEHLEQIDQKEVFHSKSLLKEAIKRQIGTPGHNIGTIVFEDAVLAIIGMVRPRFGFAEVWSITSPAVSRAPVSFHKLTLALIRHFTKSFNLVRVQMTVKEGFSQGVRWAESLGFEREGLMRKYDIDGSNHILFSRVNLDG